MAEQAERQEVPAGTVFGGVYRVVEKLGGGGMGDVYLVEETRLERRCALKVLHGPGEGAGAGRAVPPRGADDGPPGRPSRS